MTTLTAAAVAASTIILAELRQTETFDQSVVAVYAAEAGLEDALHIVKLNRQSSGAFIATTTSLGCVPPSFCSSRRTMDGVGSSWTRTAEQDESFHVVHLEPEQTVHLDLFNPDSSSGESEVASLDIDWSDSCQGYSDEHGFSIFEITMLTWEGTDLSFDPAEQQVSKETFACNFLTTRCTPQRITAVDGHAIEPTKFHRFSFRVLSPREGTGEQSCAIEDLIVTAHTSSGDIVPTPARMTVKSTGSFGNSQQALSASIPWRAPVSGLLNYVLFSGEALDVRK